MSAPTHGMSGESLTRTAADTSKRSHRMEERSAAASVRKALGLRRVSAIYLWIAFIAIFGGVEAHLFLTVSTFQVVFSQGAVTATLALAFLAPLTTDTYDLSIGEVMSLTIVLINWFTLHSHIPVAVICLGVAVFCGLIGAVSGFVVVRLRVNSLIATLGMSEVLSAFQLYVSQNHQVAATFSNLFVEIGNGKVLGIPYLDIYMVAIAAVLWFVLEQTPLGRRMFAIGGNRDAARLAGVSADRIVWGSLMASAGIASLAGIMYTLQVGAYTGDIGQGYLFPALAAVFLGASQLSQRPNVWGTLIAFFALAFGIQGLTLKFGAGTFWVSPLFQGVALIIAVAVASARGSIGGGRDGKAIRRMLRTSRSAADDDRRGSPPPNENGSLIMNNGVPSDGAATMSKGSTA